MSILIVQRNGMNYGPITPITLGSSPAVWQNPEVCSIRLMFNGLISLAEFSPDGVSFTTLAGLTGGVLLLNAGEYVRITYVTMPIVVYTPF